VLPSEQADYYSFTLNSDTRIYFDSLVNNYNLNSAILIISKHFIQTQTL